MLNKIDLLPEEEADERCAQIVRRLRWKGPTFRISGVTGQGTKELTQAVMRYLEENPAKRPTEAEAERVSA